MKRHFANKHIVLGVTGSIAAYKACELASRLAEYGAAVTPVLTHSACQLVGAASFEAICGRPAVTEMFGGLTNPDVEHITVAQSADLFLIAPATANILAKAAHGLADDWLSTSLLATTAPVLFAPAMNSQMYAHPATQANIATLRERGCRFVGPGEGRLACRTVGPGRLIDVPAILEACLPLLSATPDLAGRRVVITSGGNREPIDPVRFIGNRSSGRMGRALALEALARGAAVTLIAGPAEVPPPHACEVVPVETAAEMGDALDGAARDADVVIGAAAVADFRAAEARASKHKRGGEGLTLELVQNPDLIARAAANRRDGQIVVGFAAETDDVIANAREKLARKGLDLMVANHVGTDASGFGTEGLEAAVLDAEDRGEALENVSKDELARRLFDRIAERLVGAKQERGATASDTSV